MKILHILLLVLLTFSLSAQREVFSEDGDDFSTEFIIEELILAGVEVLNIQTNFATDDLCMGYFIDPSRQLGIEQGMVLSTGSVSQIFEPNQETNFTSFGIDSALLIEFSQLLAADSLQAKDSLAVYQQVLQNSGTGSDPDLSNEIAGLTTYDARVIEIEFIPTADTFYYRYVFASEEYDEFVCSQFNDIFAFYIYQEEDEKTNTALVPEKLLPVSINTINNGNPELPDCPKSNSFLYQSNSDRFEIRFDGFTKVLDIRFKVTAGEKYFIKIAIADASDNILDSAVLIENESIFSYFKSFELLFEQERSAIQDYDRLEQVLASLNANPKSNVQLIGHSDITGPEDYNLQLSANRVQTIHHYLISKGIAADRIKMKHKGELMPRYDRHHLNRRVEVFILGE